MIRSELPAAADVRELRLFYSDNYTAAVTHRLACEWLDMLECALAALEAAGA